MIEMSNVHIERYTCLILMLPICSLHLSMSLLQNLQILPFCNCPVFSFLLYYILQEFHLFSSCFCHQHSVYLMFLRLHLSVINPSRTSHTLLYSLSKSDKQVHPYITPLFIFWVLAQLIFSPNADSLNIINKNFRSKYKRYQYHTTVEKWIGAQIQESES